MKKALLVLVGLVLVASILGAAGVRDQVVEDVAEVSYVHWNLGTPEDNNLERQMIAAFNEAHPSINVTINDDMQYGGEYLNSLAALAASGNLPDVFPVVNIGDFLSNGWAADIADIVNADPEWATIAAPMRESSQFQGAVYMVPYSQHLFGFYVNIDLLESLNRDVPGYDWTIEDFEELIFELGQPSRPLLGVSEVNRVWEWYPVAVTDDMGWYSWDGEEFNLDSSVFRDGMDFTRRVHEAGLHFFALSDEQKEVFNAGWHGAAWDNGFVALRWDATWAIGGLAGRDFEWDFLGLPGGRPVIVPDYLAIASSSDEPEAAYEVARWMSTWGRDGFTTRMDIAQENGLSIAGLPLTDDRLVVNRYLSIIDVPGVEYQLSQLDRAAYEPLKALPGFARARWQAQVTADLTMGQLMDQAWKGEIEYEDYADQVDDIADREVREAVGAIFGR